MACKYKIEINPLNGELIVVNNLETFVNKIITAEINVVTINDGNYDNYPMSIIIVDEDGNVITE